MEKLNNIKKFVNISFYGNINAGKCSLAKSLTIACHNISTPSNFTFNLYNFFIFPIACLKLEYQEKYELSSYMCNIAIIVIDIEELFLIERKKSELNYNELLFDLYYKGVRDFVLCFNKIDKVKIDKEIYEMIVVDFNKEISGFKEEINSNCMNLFYVPISAKEDFNILSNSDMVFEDLVDNANWYTGKSLLNILSSICDNQSLEIVPKEGSGIKPIFLIYDFYRDEDYWVISGINLRVEMSVGDEYLILTINKKVKLEKICDCEGIYRHIVPPNQFITLKFDINSISQDDLNKGDIITKISENKSIEKDQSSDFACFNTFEADVMFYGDNLPTILSSGLNCFINFIMMEKHCVIESIIGEYDQGKLIKKKFIKPKNNMKAKLIIFNKSSVPIMRSKYEVDNYFGRFIINIDNKNIAYGEILRFKKLEK